MAPDGPKPWERDWAADSFKDVQSGSSSFTPPPDSIAGMKLAGGRQTVIDPDTGRPDVNVSSEMAPAIQQKIDQGGTAAMAAVPFLGGPKRVVGAVMAGQEGYRRMGIPGALSGAALGAAFPETAIAGTAVTDAVGMFGGGPGVQIPAVAAVLALKHFGLGGAVKFLSKFGPATEETVQALAKSAPVAEKLAVARLTPAMTAAEIKKAMGAEGWASGMRLGGSATEPASAMATEAPSAAAGAIAKTVEASGASAETARAVGESEAAKLASMAPEGAVSGNLPGVVKASEGGFYGPLGNRSGPGPNGPYPPAQPLQRPTIITPYGKVMPPAELPPLPGAPAAPESFYGPMGNRGGPGPQPWADPGVMDPSRIATGYPNASPVPTGVPLQRPNIPTPYGKVMPPSELPPLPGAPTKVDEIIGTVTKFRAANMDRGQIIKALKNGPMSEASLPEIGRVVDQIQKGNVVLPPYRGGPAQPGPMATAPEDIMARLQDSLAAYRTP